MGTRGGGVVVDVVVGSGEKEGEEEVKECKGECEGKSDESRLQEI